MIWKRIGSILRFSYDENNCFALDSTCIATGSNIKFIIAFLNSKIGNYLLQKSPKTGTGDLLVSIQALEPILIPMVSDKIKLEIESAIDMIILKSFENDSLKIEKQINKTLYNAIGLNSEEIEFIESQ